MKDADRTLPPSRTTEASCARFRSPPERSLIFFDCSRDRKPNLRGTRVDPDAIDALPTHQSIFTRIQRADVGASVHLALTEVERLPFPTNGLEDGLAALGVEVFARLVDRRELDGAADLDLARRHGLLAREHFYERGLPRAVRADDADDRRPRHLEAQVVNKDAVADLLPQALGDDDFFPQTRSRGNPNSTGTNRRVVRRPRGVDQRVVGLEPRFCFRAGFRGPEPL